MTTVRRRRGRNVHSHLVRMIRTRAALGDSIRSMADDYGLHRETVSRIVARKTHAKVLDPKDSDVGDVQELGSLRRDFPKRRQVRDAPWTPPLRDEDSVGDGDDQVGAAPAVAAMHIFYMNSATGVRVACGEQFADGQEREWILRGYVDQHGRRGVKFCEECIERDIYNHNADPAIRRYI